MSQERSGSGSEGARVCQQGTLCPQAFVSTPVPWTLGSVWGGAWSRGGSHGVSFPT